MDVEVSMTIARAFARMRQPTHMFAVVFRTSKKGRTLGNTKQTTETQRSNFHNVPTCITKQLSHLTLPIARLFHAFFAHMISTIDLQCSESQTYFFRFLRKT